jgi:assimilatory nitrate reductase catalytic subunit
VSRQWAVSLLGESQPRETRASLLAGRPGQDRPDPGAIVCSCNSVGINTILGAIRDGCDTLDALGTATAAGTNCGSCRAELSAALAAHLLPAEAAE